MVGYVIGQSTFDRAAQSNATLMVTLSLTSLIFASSLWYLGIGSSWLYGSNGFAVLDVSVSRGVLMRALLFFISAVMTWAIIASAGMVREVFVKAGKRSLAIYLLHGFFILPATPWMGMAFDRYGPFVASLICLASTFIVIYILSLSVFDRSLRALGTRSASLLLKALQSIRKKVHTA